MAHQAPSPASAPHFSRPWYQVSAPRVIESLGPLRGAVNSDVCVIGAGFTGLSAALDLAEHGYAVTVIEAEGLAEGASGRNGGHIHRGFVHGPGWIAAHYGQETMRRMVSLNLSALETIAKTIARHDIDCDFQRGSLITALNRRHLDELENELAEWRSLGAEEDLKMTSRDETRALVDSPAYIGGLYDGMSAHFHPYRYALGLAAAAQRRGAAFYTQSRVIGIGLPAGPGDKAVVHISGGGTVTADHVFIAGDIDLPETRARRRRSIHASAHMIATAPLGAERAAALIPGRCCVADANFIMDYFRMSQDGRLLFGGNCNYTGRDSAREHVYLRRRMLKVFPQLADVSIDHCWSGALHFTVNRMPALGELAPRVYFAHGFGGHGTIMTNLFGRLVSGAIRGRDKGDYDLFAKIRHIPFPGGPLTKRPLFILGILWYRLRDALRF